MRTRILLQWLLLAWWIVCLARSSPLHAADAPAVAFEMASNQFVVTIGGKPVAAYVWKDETITRPYFAHVRAPGGVQVTRNQPPIEGKDPTDHPTFHPGIWLAFGDISGSDYWRLKAPIVHVAFAEKPTGGHGKGGFTVRNRYLSQEDNSKPVCEELGRYTFHVTPHGYLLEWDSTFSADAAFYFGDQEEMGLGFRIASPMYVRPRNDSNAPQGNGTLLDARGRRNEEEVWSNAARWCDYSGTLDGTPAGIAIFCHPGNFRASWYHARDYGFLTANPFGREAMGKGKKSKIVVAPGASLRLRYGVLLHAGEALSAADLDAAFEDYVDVRAR